jgi:sulfatase maturation enzyme AslB (radical SAM superfamily)
MNPDLTNKFCTRPFDHFEVDRNGNAWVCCSRWLPLSIGNLNDSKVEDIIRSVGAREVKKSILDGGFKYCDKSICPDIISGTLPDKDSPYLQQPRYQTENIYDPTFFALTNDESCNLSCPSCRVKKINRTSGEIYEKIVYQNNRILDYLKRKTKENPEKEYWLHVTGSGDPFGSKAYRELLFNFDGREYPNLKLNLQTNGVMFTEKYWNMMEKCHGNLYAILVSFDAAKEDTYNITRRDGDWKTLNKNIEMLGKKRKEGFLKELRVDYVVQDHNYREMPDFVDNMDKVDFIDTYHFQKIVDWGTYPPNEFENRAVWLDSHPEHLDFLGVLKDERLRNDKIWWGNVAEFYNKAHTS